MPVVRNQQHERADTRQSNIGERVSTKDWLIRVIPLLLVLNFIFGWHEWSDHTYLIVIFCGLVIAVLEGDRLVGRIEDGQRQNKRLLERVQEEQQQNTMLLERIEDRQKRIETEQQKLRRQLVRASILIERVVATMPTVSDKEVNDDSEDL